MHRSRRPSYCCAEVPSEDLMSEADPQQRDPFFSAVLKETFADSDVAGRTWIPRTRTDDHVCVSISLDFFDGDCVVANDTRSATEFPHRLVEVIGERVEIIENERTHHEWSKEARKTAARQLRAL